LVDPDLGNVGGNVESARGIEQTLPFLLAHEVDLDLMR